MANDRPDWQELTHGRLNYIEKQAKAEHVAMLVSIVRHLRGELAKIENRDSHFAKQLAHREAWIERLRGCVNFYATASDEAMLYDRRRRARETIAAIDLQTESLPVK